jgi:hypothetical protein
MVRVARFTLGTLLALLLSAVAVQAAQAADPNPNPPPPAAVDPHVKELIAKLNAPDNIDREDAEKSLLEIGAPAVPALRDAMAAPEPEISARAKRLVAQLVQSEGRPLSSYSELFPANSVFFAEVPNAKAALEKLKPSPVGRLWDLPQTQKHYKGHYDAQTENDKKMLDCIHEIVKLVDGRALLAFGAPETAEATEIDPPLVYALESKQAHALEAQVRALLLAMNDPPRSIRRFGPFSIEEQVSAQTVFNANGMIHSLTQVGIEAVLDKFAKKPDNPLSAELADVRGLMQSYDLLFHFKHSDLNQLADAGQLIDEDMIRSLNTIGFVEGSAFQSVLTPNGDGFEEHGRIVVAGGDANDGILNVIRKMSVTPPATDKPRALDLIPWQTGILISFQGDVAQNSAALAKAIRALDAAGAPENEALKGTPAKPAKDGANKADPKLDPKRALAPNAPHTPPKPAGPAVPPAPELAKDGPEKNKTLGGEALAAGGGLDKKPDAPADAKPDAPKADEPKTIYPHVQRFEKVGVKLEQFLEQVDGPVQLGVFPHSIGDDTPDTIPMTPLVAFVLKDPKVFEQSLDALSTGDKPRFAKELLNGGVHYVEVSGNDSKPGFWLKDNYLAYSTEREVLDLASKALQHENGNERMADRPSYKQELAAKRLEAQSLFTVFGDADQILEMPYKLACLAWKPEPNNPYPDWTVVKPILLNKPVSVGFKTSKDVIVYSAQTPLSLLGMIEAFRRPIKESGL